MMADIAVLSQLINIFGWPLVTVWAVVSMRYTARQYRDHVDNHHHDRRKT